MRTFDVKSLGEAVFDSGGATPADVAIIVPLYNYEDYIIDCLKSIADQTLDRLSIVVVDDCSTDAGPALAVDFLKKHSARFRSARVVRHKRNLGPSMARNSGLAWSAESLLFMLDADNRIRPPALTRLKSALDVDGADFAYSQLFMFGIEAGVGDADIWHVDRLRYGNKIDGMAMIRRSALIKAGGYAVLADDHGLEDYDLWCRFFTLGMRGVFVPELLCEYRRHGQSRQDTAANKNLGTLIPQIALRHPEIFDREARIAAADEDLSISIPLNYKLKLKSAPTIVVVIHIFYPTLTDELLGYIENIPFEVDLYISTDNLEKKLYIEERMQKFGGRTEVRVTLQQGRDIAPRLIGFRDVFDRYEYVLLLHSKVSSHAHSLQNWRAHLLGNLIGSRKVVESIFEIFDELPEVGIIAAQHFEGVRQWLGWGENFEFCEALAARFGADLKVNGFLDYPSGSMLWARSAALRPFFDARLVLEDFAPDDVGRQIDGTMAHAVERLFFVAAEKAGFSWIKVAQPHLFERRDTIKQIHNPAELHKFVARQKKILRPQASATPNHAVSQEYGARQQINETI
jgi:glycosyltransferase involved in cell wall biosynthesis